MDIKYLAQQLALPSNTAGGIRACDILYFTSSLMKAFCQSDLKLCSVMQKVLKKKEGEIGPQTVMAHWNCRMCQQQNHFILSHSVSTETFLQFLHRIYICKQLKKKKYFSITDGGRGGKPTLFVFISLLSNLSLKIMAKQFFDLRMRSSGLVQVLGLEIFPARRK